jgi:hypothetical protein
LFNDFLQFVRGNKKLLKKPDDKPGGGIKIKKEIIYLF